MDKLDIMIRENNMRRNIVKWWNVNMVDPSDSLLANDNIDVNTDMLTDEERLLCDEVLNLSRRDDAFDKAMTEVNELENSKALDEANEIYERLMREAAEDEQKKIDEIEAAKAANN